MKNNLAFLKKHFDIIIVFISIVLMNQVLSRYFSQDVIWNDLVLESKILFLLENIRTFDFFNNIDYLYGEGLNRFSDIKNPIKFFDIGLILGLFINTKYALLIRFSIFVLIASIYLSKIGAYFKSNKTLVSLLTIFYISNPVFLSESTHLVTFVFYLFPPVFYYTYKYYSLNSKKDLIKSLFFCFILGSHTDIHSFIFSSFFILAPLVFFDINKNKIFQFFKIFLLTTGVLIFNNILLIISIIGSSSVSQKIGFSDYLSYEYLFGYISTIIPVGFQYSIYILPFIPLMLMVKKSKDLNRFITFVLLAIFFPLIIASLPLSIPSTLRYHLSIIPLMTIIFLIISLKKIDLRKTFNISLIISISLMILISDFFLYQIPISQRFLEFIIDYFKFNDSLKFIDFMYPFGFFLNNEFYRKIIICFVPLIIPLGIYLIKRKSKIYYVLISMYMVIIYQQRFITSSILVSKSINKEISLIEENISGLIPKNSSLFYTSVDVFNDRSGRNDILMPFIHKRTSGIKKYNQWNYSYEKNDIDFYQKITESKEDCCFYPPSIDKFKLNHKLILSKNIDYLISGDSLLNMNYLQFIKAYSLYDKLGSKDREESLFGKLYLYKIKN